ncbi:hypothetical protein KC19_1G204800 [Ceratodon purpureus]|uniref:Uncharacterized protein n=1 Tax=Ceratodon purpureus TaxID=3225 RepID=A0A8T0J7E1_CERPU|nr:hypothetical protein KC19_1G204800 [Ceratodon purpureus]
MREICSLYSKAATPASEVMRMQLCEEASFTLCLSWFALNCSTVELAFVTDYMRVFLHRDRKLPKRGSGKPMQFPGQRSWNAR